MGMKQSDYHKALSLRRYILWAEAKQGQCDGTKMWLDWQEAIDNAWEEYENLKPLGVMFHRQVNNTISVIKLMRRGYTFDKYEMGTWYASIDTSMPVWARARKRYFGRFIAQRDIPF